MNGVIKKQIEILRTNVAEVIPKFFKFWKMLFVGILSALIWTLYFIGAAADILNSMIVMIKKKVKGKNESR